MSTQTDPKVERPNLEEIEARLANATPGPWAITLRNERNGKWLLTDIQTIGEIENPDPHGSPPTYVARICTMNGLSPNPTYSRNRPDAQLIANAPTDLRALLTYARCLEAQAERERGGAEVALLRQERGLAVKALVHIEGIATGCFGNYSDIATAAKQALDRIAALSTQTEGRP